jgi:hypothetical protein
VGHQRAESGSKHEPGKWRSCITKNGGLAAKKRSSGLGRKQGSIMAMTCSKGRGRLTLSGGCPPAPVAHMARGYPVMWLMRACDPVSQGVPEMTAVTTLTTFQTPVCLLIKTPRDCRVSPRHLSYATAGCESDGDRQNGSARKRTSEPRGKDAEGAPAPMRWRIVAVIPETVALRIRARCKGGVPR